MKRTLVRLLLSVLAVYSMAQPASLDQDGFRRAMEKIQSASATQDGQAYALFFANDATWDGPLGQNAIGRENIGRAAQLMFSTLGPLQLTEWHPRRLSADVVMVDMYQAVVNAPSASLHNVPTAPGSIAARGGCDIRTTLVLRRDSERWIVVAARLADIRASKTRHPVSASGLR